jgi:hypothetical protein
MMGDTALNLAQVLWEERIALARTRPGGSVVEPRKPSNGDELGGAIEPEDSLAAKEKDRPHHIREIYRILNADNRWALCLSGGGIRSAAFALGILQRFAAQPIAPKVSTDEAGSVLQQFEYLSTVSGGGYIGCWLSAWLFQERKKRAETGRSLNGSANAVIAALTGRIDDHAEFGTISNLRRDSHYLAPSFSAISPDLWSDIAGVVRNLFLNWILFIPPMILAVLITKALAYMFIDALGVNKQSAWFVIIMIAATFCFIVGLSFAAANRPARGLINASQAQFLLCDLAIFLTGAALLIFILGSPNGEQTLAYLVGVVGSSWMANFGNNFPLIAVLLRGVVLGVAIYLLSWSAAPLWKWILREPSQPRLELRAWYVGVDLVAWCVAGAVFGALIAAGYLLLFQLYHPEQNHTPDRMSEMMTFVTIIALPWITLARIVADIVFVAFVEFMPGADAGLEYQARTGGIFMLAELGWLIWFGLVLWAPTLELWTRGWVASLAAVGGISGAFPVIFGFSSKTSAIIQPATGLRQYLRLSTLAAVAAAIFAAVLVAVLSILLDWASQFDPFKQALDQNHPSWPLVLTAGGVLAVLIATASLVISINRYSLHSIYRDRLVRAFLGASRNEDERDKTKNRFTDFDSRDSPLLHQLWENGTNPRGDNWKPLLVINAALNLVSSKNLAWQERMAAPFTFSPLHCGSGSSIFPDGAYRVTYPSPGRGKPYGARLGLTLGTAMAISGAAVSPNMGYNTSPGVAFLMALFNVRLGWWLANPRGDNANYWRTKPRVALRPYFMEMFGLTSETERWVYLSDGGHFENLGIYEMVRRRSRVIVVSDAGCDPDYTFDDLGNALRKIWIDLGVRIEIHGLDRLKKRFKERPTPATQEPYWAVGRIRYSAADGGGDDGWLLYLKSGLHGTEPMDVLSYAMTHTEFPHETTANQFFTESQFESYRMLGFEIVDRALEAGGCPPLATAPAGTTEQDAATKVALTLDVVIKNLDAQLMSSSCSEHAPDSLSNDRRGIN